jgi:ribosomal subunit interface protein
MQTSLKITFRHMTPSAALEAHVREHVEDLERVYDRIIACDVVIDAPAGRHVQGESFDVRVNVKVPHGNFNVRNDRTSGVSPRDVYGAVREAFGSLERMLARHSATVHGTRDHRTIRREHAPGHEASQP